MVVGCIGIALFCSRGSAAQTTKPTTAPGKVTYDLGGKYKAGQRLLLTATWGTQASLAGDKDNADDPADVLHSYSHTLELPVSVSPSGTPGDVNVQLTMRRMAYTYNSGDRIMEMDSDRPETLPDQVAESMMIGARIHAVLDKAGKAKTITPDDTYLAKPYYANMKPARRAREVQSQCDILSYFLTQPWAYMPNRPVAIGDSWAVMRTSYMVPILAMRVDMDDDGMPVPRPPKEDVQCSLKEIEKTRRGTVATIAIVGKIEVPQDMSGEFQDIDIDVAGTVRLNIDTGELLEHHMEITAARDGMNIRCTATTTLKRQPTSQPATAPATAPSKS